jgi:hypothetical protein
MKKLLFGLVFAGVVCLFLLANSVSVFKNESLRFGTTFQDTDSLILRKGDVSATLLNTTLYSDVITSEQSEEGIWNVSVYLDSSSGPSTSIALSARLVEVFRKGSGGSFFGGGSNEAVIKFGPWKTIFASMKIDTLYKKTITPADSSWFMPASGIQYRLVEAHADTCTPYVKQYKR